MSKLTKVAAEAVGNWLWLVSAAENRENFRSDGSSPWVSGCCTVLV